MVSMGLEDEILSLYRALASHKDNHEPQNVSMDMSMPFMRIDRIRIRSKYFRYSRYTKIRGGIGRVEA